MADGNNWPTNTPNSEGEHTQENKENETPTAANEQPTSTLPPLNNTVPGNAGVNEQSEPAGNSTRSPEPYRLAPQYGAFAPQDQTTRVVPPVQEQQNTQNTQNTQSGLPFQTQNNQQNMPFGAPAPQNRNPYGNANGTNGQPTMNNPFGPAGPTGPKGPNGSMPNNGANGPAVPQQPRTANNIIVAVVAALVAAALCLGIGYLALTEGWVNIPNSSSMSSVSNGQSGSGTAKVEGGQAVDWTSVAANVTKSVVSIQTTVSDGTAKGSGAILDKDGHIVTNNHVVSGAKQIQVTLSNGDIYGAQIVGTDSTTDLAVIKLDNPPSDLTPVTFADSDNLAQGEAVMAVGNPLGYEDTVTTGIVSALNRPVTVMDEDNSTIVTNAVQIDASINPGNSGGPTFNAAGQVIGINSSIASTASNSSSAGSIGIGFAIPSNLVKRVSQEIIKNGKAEHVALGVTIQSSTVESDGVTRGGAVVKSVVANSPAAKAGLKTGDTIVGFNGVSVTNNYSLLGFVRAAAMNSAAKLTIVRDGKTMEVNVTFDQAEASVNGNNRSESNNNSQNNDNNNNNQNNNNNNNNDNSDGLIDPFGMW